MLGATGLFWLFCFFVCFVFVFVFVCFVLFCFVSLCVVLLRFVLFCFGLSLFEEVCRFFEELSLPRLSLSPGGIQDFGKGGGGGPGNC